MKQHMQTVINVCLAIGFTLLIYQNIQLKERIDTADFFAQHSVDETWDRMDKMEAETIMIKDRVGIETPIVNRFGDIPVYYTVNERLTSYGLKVMENEARLDDNDTNINQLFFTVNKIEEYIVEEISGRPR